MTSWQIFALSSPAIIVVVMWLQGLIEGHLETSPSSQKNPSVLAERFSTFVETATKRTVSGFFLPRDVVIGALGAAYVEREMTNLSDAEKDALRILAESLRLEVEANAETPSAQAEIADSDAPSKKAS